MTLDSRESEKMRNHVILKINSIVASESMSQGTYHTYFTQNIMDISVLDKQSSAHSATKSSNEWHTFIGSPIY